VENSLCVQILRSPILAALLYDTRAVGVRQLYGVISSCDRVAIPFDIGQSDCLVKAKFHYASLFGAGLKLVRAKFHYTSWLGAGSEVPNRFGAGSELVRR